MARKFNSRSIIEHINLFRQEVKTLELHGSLQVCNRVAADMFTHDQPVFGGDDHYVTPWFIAFLAKELLLNASDDGKKPLDKKTLFSLSRSYALVSVGQFEERTFSTHEDEFRAGIKVQYERRLWIEPIKNLIARTYYTLFAPAMPSVAPLQKQWQSMFEEMYQVDSYTLFRVTMGIFMSCHRNGEFKREYLTNTAEPEYRKWFTNDNIDAVLKHMSTDIRQFRKHQLRESASSPMQRIYEFNYLLKKPIVTDERGHSHCPFPMLLAHRLSTGVYFDMIDYLNATGGKVGEFTTPYGKLFEAYVGRLLEEFFTLDKNLLWADKYFTKKQQNKGVCDWIVLEDKCATLIECKSSRLPLPILKTGNISSFKKFLLERYLNNGKGQFEYCARHFSQKGYEIRSLIVYNDYIAVYNDFAMLYKWYPEVVNRLEEFRTQFASIYEFEKTLPLVKHVALSEILDKKMSSPSLRAGDLSLAAEKFPEFTMEGELATVKNVYNSVFGEVE